MNNIFDRKLKQLDVTPKKVIHSTDILPKTIKQRHVDGIILKTGVASDRPNGSSDVKMYYEIDTKKLKIWNSVDLAWDEVAFS